MSSRCSPLALCLLLVGIPTYAEEQAPTSDTTEPTSAETSAETTAIPRAPLLERSEVSANALEQQLQPGEQQQLQAADEAFLGLWLPANTGNASGAVIIIPGGGESADWPQVISPLRHKLPDAGWQSLSITLPDPNQPFVPARSTADAPGPEDGATTADGDDAADAPTAAAPTDEQPTDAADDAAPAPTPESSQAAAETPGDPETLRRLHAARVIARIEAAVAFAQQQQAQAIVLLGHGSGAYWAAHYLKERQPDNVRHLVVVASERPVDYGPGLDELLPGLKLATGDFYYKDRLSDRQAAIKRLQASKRQQHPAYTQVAMKALPGNTSAEQEQLYRRVRGWLSKQLEPAKP
jgi:hypothetical protein